MVTLSNVYLSDSIDVTFAFSATSADKVYPYTIKEGDTVIFSGNCFIAKGSTAKTLNLNGVLRSHAFINSYLRPNADRSTMSADNNVLHATYTVAIDGIGSSDVSVYMVNRYPVIHEIMLIGQQYGLPTDDYGSNNVNVYLQGLQYRNNYTYETGKTTGRVTFLPALVPRYPAFATINYAVIIACNINGSPTGIELTGGNNIGSLMNSGDNTICMPLRQFLSDFDDRYGYTLCMYDAENTSGNAVLVVQLDKCPARYYVQWQDRMGSVQSQPFEGTDTIMHSYERVNMQDYNNATHAKSISITSTVKVNSGWVSEDIMPFYESILVSPYVRLYDYSANLSYDVRVVDSEFVEKTFENQGRKMFNISLTLEKADKQTMLC